MSSIAEDLVWLLLDDNSGEFLVDRGHVAFAVEVAALLDMAADLTEVTVGEMLADGRFGFTALRRNHLEDVLFRAAERGRTCAMPARRFGIFRMWSWPTLDFSGKRALRGSIRRALSDTAGTDVRTAVLIALLTAVHGMAAQWPDRQSDEVDRLAWRVLRAHPACREILDVVRRRTQADYAASFCGMVQPIFQRQPQW
ncbi:MAG: hypothetical protein JWN03_4229 [Nocardia sp.]|uniref:GPP34 family phosphoprotein n=1 Tax=Nocardia sp. TaxID=1821 RepID=UPI00260291F1|nr:GPP34 family phosphoprotein [Nocardia sp.]MCU1643954.1 hypothetical protein [Nocardia sp.]